MRRATSRGRRSQRRAERPVAARVVARAAIARRHRVLERRAVQRSRHPRCRCAASGESPRPTTDWCSTFARYRSRKIWRIPILAWDCTPIIPIANRCRDFKCCMRWSLRRTAARACSATASPSRSTCATTSPDAFALLTQTPVPFLYRSKDAELYAERPLIQLSCRGEVSAVHYNSRSIAPLRLAARDAHAFYAAYRRFAALLRDPRFHLQFRLRDGDLVVFDNQRILHGRTAFSSAKASAPLARLLLDSRQRVLRGRAAAPRIPPRKPRMNVTEEILAIFQKRGSSAYFGESVSMTEHALQAAYFARAARAPPALIVAALLHDIGHLIDDVPSDIATGPWTRIMSRSAAAGSPSALVPKFRSPCACTSLPSAISWPPIRVFRQVESCLGHHSEATRRPHGGA